jgi:hypothetical protein
MCLSRVTESCEYCLTVLLQLEGYILTKHAGPERLSLWPLADDMGEPLRTCLAELC